MPKTRICGLSISEMKKWLTNMNAVYILPHQHDGKQIWKHFMFDDVSWKLWFLYLWLALFDQRKRNFPSFPILLFIFIGLCFLWEGGEDLKYEHLTWVPTFAKFVTIFALTLLENSNSSTCNWSSCWLNSSFSSNSRTSTWTGLMLKL